MTQSAYAWRLMACSDPAFEDPLLARMTKFWFNHLNVFESKGNVRPFVGHYVVNAIRANALGKFKELLLASARHPATAKRIATRLATTFVSDQPPRALVDQLARTFTSTQGDIASVMRALVTSPDFWQTDNTFFKLRWTLHARL